MPITFNLDQEVIFTTATGILSCEDILSHIQAKKRAGILPLPELFDAREVTLDLSVDDLKDIAAAVGEALHGKAPGKTAVVTNSAFLFGLARSYADLARDTNPEFEVYYDFDVARDWLLGRSA